MTLDRLILDDFLTYDHLDYMFEVKPLLIQGLNLTDEGQTTNGTGKSGLQTGIEQCITASNSRDVRDNEIITYGKQQARAQLFASCTVRKETIHIDWDIKLSGSNVLRLKTKKFDSEEWIDVSFSNVNDGKKAIMDWFAISREDLFNYYIINKSRFKSFFQSSNTDKVALINRFSDASIIEGVENIDLKQLEEDYAAAELKINETSGKIELLNEQILTATSKDFKAEFQAENLKIDEEISDIEEEVLSLGNDIITENNKKPEINKKIAAQKIDVKNTLEGERTQIQGEIDTIDETIAIATDELNKAQKLVDDFKATDWQAKKQKFTTEIDEIKGKKTEVKTAKETANGQLQKILEFIQGIDVILSGAITCPHCKGVFVLEGDIEELKVKKTQGDALKEKAEKLVKAKESEDTTLDERITKIQESVSGINKLEETEMASKNLLVTALNTATRKLDEVNASRKTLEQKLILLGGKEDARLLEITTLESALTTIKNSVANTQKEIDNYKVEIELLKGKKEALKVGNSKDLIKTYKNDLEGLEVLIKGYRATHTTLGDKIYEGNQWIFNFKQFRMHLANQSLGVIEYHCNRYLTEMKSDLTVKMDGFKVLASGAFKEEITATIIRNGRERTFSSFSGGERGRLLFASILANRHMINETHPYGGLHFLAIDEVFEGVDASGLESLIESAKLLNIPVMVITHVSVDENSANVLTIVKENSISKIKNL
jgi:exonuclease SbcC